MTLQMNVSRCMKILENLTETILCFGESSFYKNLFQLHPKDYNGWAHGLKKAGYATNLDTLIF